MFRDIFREYIGYKIKQSDMNKDGNANSFSNEEVEYYRDSIQVVNHKKIDDLIYFIKNLTFLISGFYIAML